MFLSLARRTKGCQNQDVAWVLGCISGPGPFFWGGGGACCQEQKWQPCGWNICVHVCVRVHAFAYVWDRLYLAMLRGSKDTKNRNNSKWQRGGRAKLEGLVIIKWRTPPYTHTYTHSRVSSLVQRLPQTYILCSSVFVAHENLWLPCVFVCVCVCVAYRADIFVLNSMLLSPAHELWKCLEVTKHGLQPRDTFIELCDVMCVCVYMCVCICVCVLIR